MSLVKPSSSGDQAIDKRADRDLWFAAIAVYLLVGLWLSMTQAQVDSNAAFWGWTGGDGRRLRLDRLIMMSLRLRHARQVLFMSVWICGLAIVLLAASLVAWATAERRGRAPRRASRRPEP